MARASNVPAEQAWLKVQRGRIGTRNATYLALDCFHPQLDPRHLWLTPITRAVNLQMVRNAPYCDYLLETTPTLSPLTLAPNSKALDQSIAWDRASAEQAIPFVLAMQEPVWWEGDAPSFEQATRTALDPRQSAVDEAPDRGGAEPHGRGSRAAGPALHLGAAEPGVRGNTRTDRVREFASAGR